MQPILVLVGDRAEVEAFERELPDAATRVVPPGPAPLAPDELLLPQAETSSASGKTSRMTARAVRAPRTAVRGLDDAALAPATPERRNTVTENLLVTRTCETTSARECGWMTIGP